MSKSRSLALFCNQDSSKCESFDAQGVVLDGEESAVRIIDATNGGEVSKRFLWSAFECQVISSSLVTCTMKAQRDDIKGFLVQMLPGALMLITGFAAFLMPDSFAMPRVGTTMIALMTFVTKGSSVFAEMPTIDVSFLEFFYLAGTGTMLLNMIGHVLVLAYPRLSEITDFFALQVTLWAFFVVLAAFLHSKGCERLPYEETLTILIIAIVAFVVALALGIWKIFLLRRQASQKKCDEEDDPVREGETYI